MALFCGAREISGIRVMPAVKGHGRVGLAPAGAPGCCSLDCVPESGPEVCSLHPHSVHP